MLSAVDSTCLFPHRVHWFMVHGAKLHTLGWLASTTSTMWSFLSCEFNENWVIHILFYLTLLTCRKYVSRHVRTMDVWDCFALGYLGHSLGFRYAWSMTLLRYWWRSKLQKGVWQNVVSYCIIISRSVQEIMSPRILVPLLPVHYFIFYHNCNFHILSPVQM